MGEGESGCGVEGGEVVVLRTGREEKRRCVWVDGSGSRLGSRVWWNLRRAELAMEFLDRL